MIKRITIKANGTKLYNSKGTHAGTANKGEYVDGSDNLVSVGTGDSSRGLCYAFEKFWVRKGDVTLSAVPVTAPPPTPVPTPPPLPVPSGLYRHLHDVELQARGVWITSKEKYVVPRNNLPGTPQVHELVNYSVVLTRQWQYYLAAINPGMELRHVSALLHKDKAFTNNMGFPDRRNYLLDEGKEFEDPKFDATYICGGGMISGVVSVDGKSLLAKVMDGWNPPPLKIGEPGKPPIVYPSTIDKVHLDDYLYTPQSHPWLFVVAVNVRSDGVVSPFDNGALYDWTPDRRPYTFLPLVSRKTILYPLDRLKKVSGWVSPYVVEL